MNLTSNLRITFLLSFIILLSSCEEKELSPPNESLKEDNSGYLDLVNAIRKEGATCGTVTFSPTTPLVWNSIIEQSAYKHSKDMAEKNYFGHVGFDGSDGGKRLLSLSYSWTAWGENLYKATGFTPTKKQVVDAWKNSPGHCQNLMNPRFKEMGVGEFNNIYTQVFGSK